MGDRIAASISAFERRKLRWPPRGIASRALTARFMSTCSAWAGSTMTRPTSGPVDVMISMSFADEPAQHRVHAGDDRTEVEDTRLEDLLSAEREQLLGELARGLGRRADRLDAAAGRRVGGF